MKITDLIFGIIKRIPRPVWVFMEYLGRHNLSMLSAYTTFFLVLSSVPMLITLLAIIPFTPMDAQFLVTIITTITPDFADGVVVEFINAAYAQSVSLLSVSILVAIWSASKGMQGLMSGLNEIAQVKKIPNSILRRILAILYTLALIFIFLAMLVVLVFGDLIVTFLEKVQPDLGVIWRYIMKFDMVLILFPAVILIVLMYTLIPMKKQTLRSQIPGAVVCAIGWGVLSAGFSIYIKFFGSGSLYGSLATPMLFMLWLYFCVMSLFIGAILNEALAGMAGGPKRWFKKQKTHNNKEYLSNPGKRRV